MARGTEPTGYKIVRYKLNENGKYLGEEDFISGWLTKNNEALGRPVDIIIQPGGTIYISDDKVGIIYKVNYIGGRAQINSFEECVSAGYPVMESYPRQCVALDGRNFVEDIGNDNDSRVKDGCLITGCSGQICAEENIITTCEFLPGYECYRDAICKRQENGECGWTESEKLMRCLDEKRKK